MEYKRIVNEANEDKIIDIRVKDLEYSNIYGDITILNMREQFKNDEEFIMHLAQLLDLNLVIEKKGRRKND